MIKLRKEKIYLTLLWTLLAVLLPFICLGSRIKIRQKQIDSLTIVLKRTTDLGDQADLLNQLSQRHREIYKYDIAIEYAEKARKKAQESRYHEGEAEALHQYGVAELDKGNYKEALEILEEGVQLASESNNEEGKGKLYNSIGLIYSAQDLCFEAIPYHEKALGIFEKLQDDTHIANSAESLASCHYNLGNYNEALRYLPTALEKYKKINKMDRIASSLIYLGLINSDAGNLKQAQDYFEEALTYTAPLKDYRFDCTIYQNIGHVKDKQVQIDSAVYYYTKALNTGQSHQDSMFVAYAYYNIAKMKWKKFDSDKSLLYLDSTENAANKLIKHTLLPLIWGFKAQIYNHVKDYPRAKTFAEKSLAYHQRTAEKAHLVTDYKTLASINENMGDYKSALANYKLYRTYQDSLDQNDMSKMIMKYDYEKKEAEIKAEQQEVLARKNLVANTTYGVLGAVIVLTGLGLYTYWIRNKKLRLEKQNVDLRRREAELAKDAEVFKSRFLSNISHEFRTPLTLISGHLEILKKEVDSKYLSRLKEMDYSGRRLLQLINQLLDLTKIESGKYNLYYKKGNLLSEAVTYVQAFHSLAEERQVDLSVKVTDPAKRIFEQHDFAYSSDALASIFNNLLSNALKFTPANGRVEVFIDVVGGRLYLQVKDNGPGIPTKDLPYIFDRFHQAEHNKKAPYEGSGIGLAIVKELAQIHGGEVSVENNAHGGCTFTVWLASGESISREISVAEIQPNTESIDTVDDTEGWDMDDAEKPFVLVIEDQRELRRFIVENLRSKYRILEAENGQVGITMAQEHLPDIIISDVMMPEVNGFQVTQQLKENEITSHIPIVLLTAKATLDDKLEGLKIGADDYLTKPFSIAELVLRIQNRLRQQENLRRKFAQDPLYLEKEDTPELNAVDRAFIEKLNNLVQDNIDKQIDVSFLASEIGLSNSQLTRKLKVLIGTTPANFIRNIQLHYALQMLRDGHPVAQACWKAGFTDPAYFTKIFKKHFGFLPSDKERL